MKHLCVLLLLGILLVSAPRPVAPVIPDAADLHVAQGSPFQFRLPPPAL